MYVRFLFSLLLPGLYACRGGQNSPCLVYVGFNQKVYVYWSVMLERIESSNILRVLEENDEFTSILKELNVGKCFLLCLFLDIYTGLGPYHWTGYTECTFCWEHEFPLMSTSKCVPVQGY